MPVKMFPMDPRYFQIFFLGIFLSYGIFFLDWFIFWLHDLVCMIGCLSASYAAESFRQKRFLNFLDNPSWATSTIISALSLCLLLKTNHWYTSLLASFLTVASKYILRLNKKHIFNPSAFGIVATIWLTKDAWLSPGQWGSNAVLFFTVLALGTIVVTRVQKLDISLTFLLTFIGLLYWRQIYQLGWPIDYFFHSISTGSLLLFSFFMISDPKTSPNHPLGRIFFGFVVALISFYWTTYQWKYNTPLWVLVILSPLVPVLDRILVSHPFEWTKSIIQFNVFQTLKKKL